MINRLLRSARKPEAILFQEASLPSFFHREHLIHGKAAHTAALAHDQIKDSELIDRIIAAYQKVNKSDLGDSMWRTLFLAHHQDIHRVLNEWR